MSERKGQDIKPDDGHELSFELREMLHMLGRIESVHGRADDVTSDLGDDLDLGAFAL